MRIGSVEITPLSAMLVFIPICTVLELMHADPVWIFVTAGLGIIPLAGVMGTATEHLAEHYGAGIGGLLNATFGNAAELIIGLVARALKPGDDGMGIIATTLVGVGGSFLGTYGGRALGLYGANQVAGFIAGVVGAVILLVILALVKRK